MEKNVEAFEIPPPVELTLANRVAMRRYGVDNALWTPPGGEDGHYLGMYLWDSCYSAMVLAENDFIIEAEQEIDSLLASQNELTGFFPNMTRIIPRPAWKEIEWRYFTNQTHSDYTQPPMMAQAAMSVYDAYLRNNQAQEGRDFLFTRYQALKKGYDYFISLRQNGITDPLINNIHPNETGRDSCPTHDYMKPRLARNGINTNSVINLANAALDGVGTIRLNRANYKVGWDIQAIRKHYNFNDIMFNVKYCENLRVMADIAKTLARGEEQSGFEQSANDLINDSLAFTAKAVEVERAILDKMWDPRARDSQGAFYALNEKGHVKETTISNLYPILLAGISPKQLEACLDIMESEFGTEFPLSTVSTKSPNFDPHYTEKPIMWRGTVWQWTNSDIVRGLMLQAERPDLPSHTTTRCRALAKWIAESSAKLVANSPSEFHDPITGEGYRTTNFAGAARGWPARDSLLVDQQLIDRLLGIKLNLLSSEDLAKYAKSEPKILTDIL